MDKYVSIIKSNLEKVKERIAKAAAKAGTDPAAVKITGVTKSHSRETIDAGIRAGIRFIAENRVQEAEKKLPQLTEEYEEFHFIGHLQKNKINKLLPLRPALIHSIDKLSTAVSLNKALERENLRQKILIQINTSGEESKFGVSAEYDKIRELVYKISQLERLEIEGLMTIGKFTENERESRRCFAALREYFELLDKESISGVKMKILSMGMTSDYPLAVEEGANLVRIGTALFGVRPGY